MAPAGLLPSAGVKKRRCVALQAVSQASNTAHSSEGGSALPLPLLLPLLPLLLLAPLERRVAVAEAVAEAERWWWWWRLWDRGKKGSRGMAP